VGVVTLYRSRIVRIREALEIREVREEKLGQGKQGIIGLYGHIVAERRGEETNCTVHLIYW